MLTFGCSSAAITWFTRRDCLKRLLASKGCAIVAGGVTILGVAKRLWIPLLVLAVVFAGGFAVSKMRGVFGSERRQLYSDTKSVDTETFNPKRISYEISGSPGAVADISYVDADANPQFVAGARLPWSLDIEIDATSAPGSVMAQGDSDDITCRILVDGKVKAERTSQQTNAFTSCLLKSA